MLRRKGSCQPQYVFKFHYLMCTCVSTWNMHVEVREQFSGIVSLLPSCVSWGTKLRSWGLVQAPLLTEPPWCPAPNLCTVAETPVSDGDGTPSMRDAICWPGSWKATGLWTPGLGLAAFLQELSLCESRKPREMVWLELRAGLDCWSEETYLKVSWPHTSGGQSGECSQGLSWNYYQTWRLQPGSQVRFSHPFSVRQ